MQMMKRIEEKVVKSKKVALFVAIVFLFVTVISMVAINTAFAEEQAPTTESVSPSPKLSSEPSGSAEPSLPSEESKLPAQDSSASPDASPSLEPSPSPEASESSAPEESASPSPEASPSSEPSPSPSEPSLMSLNSISGDKSGNLVALGLERIYVYNAPDAASVSVNYNGSTKNCSKEFGVWYTGKGSYDQSEVQSVTLNGSITIPRSQLSVNNGLIANVHVFLPRPTCTVIHNYYTSVDGGAYNLDDTDTDTSECDLLQTINQSDIVDNTNDGKTYSLYSINPSTPQQIGLSGITFTVEYRRSMVTADITIVREYNSKIGSGTYTTDGTASVTVKAIVGDKADPKDLPKDNIYLSNKYVYEGVSPSNEFTMPSGGKTVTQTYKRHTKTLTIKHKYYTGTNGGSPEYDGTTTVKEERFVGSTVDVSEVTKDTSYDGHTYTYQNVSPASDFEMPDCDKTVTLTYERNITTARLTIRHEYYTSINGGSFSLVGTDTDHETRVVGEEVNVNNITKDNSYDGKNYTYKSVNPTDNFDMPAEGATVILRYERNETHGTITIVRNYYSSIDGGSDILDGTDTESITKPLGTWIVPLVLPYDFTYNGSPYLCTEVSPLGCFTLTAEGATINQTYHRNVQTLTIRHHYSTSLNGGSMQEDGTHILTELHYSVEWIDLGDINQIDTYKENKYTYKKTVPSCSFVMGCSPRTVDLYYERNMANYSIMHEYFTSRNGSSYVPDGATTPQILTGYVGAEIDLSAIQKEYIFNDGHYVFDSFAPTANPTLSAQGTLTIRLIYQRDLKDYTIVHKYYTSTNGGALEPDGSTSQTATGTIGDIIDLSTIPLQLHYNDNDYTFQRFDPLANPTLTNDGSKSL